MVLAPIAQGLHREEEEVPEVVGEEVQDIFRPLRKTMVMLPGTTTSVHTQMRVISATGLRTIMEVLRSPRCLRTLASKVCAIRSCIPLRQASSPTREG